ncbi:hypothetical protein NDU88_006657 [Pleurodeles waltl]|uniref:Uncharacterized protein n=1 Tax=Pleurodeles waltl TaxID=8319 RepID=A0AAV7X1Q2_PLEWA|nr:hypothetical protein NDU88_006657 [Pleurodeles waltl]
MQFLDSSVQEEKKKRNPTSRDRPGSLLRSVTATSEPLHPPLHPEAESRGREREESGPSSAPIHRPAVSGRLVGRTATAASAAAAVYAAGKYRPPRANPARLLCYGRRGRRAFGSPSAPLMGGTARAQLRRR